CGGRIGRLEAGARYGVGSLVNSLLPGHAGWAVRVALFSRGLAGSERLWVASGIPAAIGAARAFLLAVLVLAAAAGVCCRCGPRSLSPESGAPPPSSVP